MKRRLSTLGMWAGIVAGILVLFVLGERSRRSRPSAPEIPMEHRRLVADLRTNGTVYSLQKHG
jgi:hypothetical protein